MNELYHQIVLNLRGLMARILEVHLAPDEFLDQVVKAAKDLDPERLEARVYEVDFMSNTMYLRSSTHVDTASLSPREKVFAIRPKTITGDAIIENRVIVATKEEGYEQSRFKDGEDVRAAFPIEFFDADMPEGRTRFVLVVEKKGSGALADDIVAALKDYSVLAGLAISIKELRDRMGRYYEENRNLVLTGRHSASIGHDIRSLNIGVGGYINAALRHLEDYPADEHMDNVKKHLHLARDNSGQIEALLKNFSQFNKARISWNRDTDLLDAVTDKIYSLANREDYSDLVRFDLIMPGEKTGFLVDRDWFGTVIENLVKNSVEACPDNPVITVRLVREKGRVLLSFQDNCRGIPADMLHRLFTPFQSSKTRGQGLGLANAKKVVEEHGGVITVENRPGDGVVFAMEFDLNGK